MKQYIGARYVPKFHSGAHGTEWENGVSYEALTVVTYNGNSYTSKVPVPVGVGAPNTAPNYWALTANFNAQVEEYRQTAERYSEEAEQVKNKVSNKGRKYIFIGDSYGTELHHGGWINYVARLKRLTAGVDYWSNAVGGVGFAINRGVPTFADLLTSITNTLSEKERNSITDVVVQGSVNDWASSSDDITAGFVAVEEHVMQYYPNATMWVPCIGWMYNPAGGRAGVVNAYNWYHQASRYARVIDKAYKILLDPYYLSSDCVHPTEMGMWLTGHNVVNILNGGTPYFNEHDYLVTTFTGAQGGEIRVRGNITDYGYNLYKHDGVGLRFDDAPITIPNNGGNGVLIATHEGANNNNLFMRKCQFPCAVLLNTSPNGYRTAHCLVTVEKVEGEMKWNMYIKSLEIDNETKLYDIPSVTGVYLTFNTFVDIFSN